MVIISIDTDFPLTPQEYEDINALVRLSTNTTKIFVTKREEGNMKINQCYTKPREQRNFKKSRQTKDHKNINSKKGKSGKYSGKKNKDKYNKKFKDNKKEDSEGSSLHIQDD